MDEMDAAYLLFDELTPTTSDSGTVDSSKNGNPPETASRRLLARALGLELTVDRAISLSKTQHERIDKLLSDVAQVLLHGNEEESQSTEYYISSRAADVDTNGQSTAKGPTFNCGFESSISESTSFAEPAPAEGPVRPERTLCCFNCEGTHNLSECTEPKDFAKIRKNRLAFQQKSSGPQGGRYHREKDAKFNQYLPGQISESLRDALGLRPMELPPWIYEMRVLGYPPGHFRTLTQPRQKLTIYNERNNGATEQEASDALDASNFVEYPGFNASLPRSVRDESRKYGYPPMHPASTKESFLASLSAATGRRFSNGMHQTPLKFGSGDGSSPAVVEISDDDTCEDSKRTSKSGSGRSGSPSIEALELVRRKLRAELEDEEPSPKRQRLNMNGSSSNGGHTSSSTDSDSVMEVKSPDASPDTGIEEPFQSPTTIPLNDSAEEASTSTSSSAPPSTIASSHSLIANPGTPVTGGFVQVSKPFLDSFASGITPFSPKEESPVASGKGFMTLKAMLKTGKSPNNSS